MFRFYQIHKQKEHIESLSSQFWDISDKYLRLQQANNKRDTLLSSVINKDSLATDDGVRIRNFNQIFFFKRFKIIFFIIIISLYVNNKY